MLKSGGRAAIVIKNTPLSNSDNASVRLRKLVLESCSLYIILDCPGGTFQGTGVKTVMLFFRNMGKTNPLNDADLTELWNCSAPSRTLPRAVVWKLLPLIEQHFNGAGIQHFTGEVLARFVIPLPPLPVLRSNVAKIECLLAETQGLESIYWKEPWLNQSTFTCLGVQSAARKRKTLFR